MNFLSRKTARASERVPAEPTQDARLDAAAQELQGAIAKRGQAMQEAADALAAATLRRDELQAKAATATERHRSLAADRLAQITATREAGDALVRDGNEEAGSAKLMTAASLEQGSDAAGAAVRGAELLAASLNGALAEQEARCVAGRAAVDVAQLAHQKARRALLAFEFDRAAAVLVERTTALLVEGGELPHLDLTIGQSIACREVVGLHVPQQVNRVKLQYAAQGRRDAETAAAAPALEVEE